MKRGNIKVDLYNNTHLKIKVSKATRDYLDKYVAKYGGLNMGRFNQEFHPTNGAKHLCEKYLTPEQFKELNTEGLTSNDFLYVLAYIFDRAVPYYLYKKDEEIHNRKPKPPKNWSSYIFPKDKIGGVAGQYKYQVDEDCVLDLLSKKRKNFVWGNEYFLNGIRYTIGKPTMRNGNFRALVSKYNPQWILQFMVDHNYAEIAFAVLMGNKKRIIELEPKWTLAYLDEIKTYRNSMKDKKTNLQYLQDVVASWIYEDAFMDYVKNNFQEVKIYHNGSDGARNTLSNETTCKADFEVEYMGIRAKLEFVTSHSEYTYQTGILNQRLNKVERLIQQDAMLINLETYSYEASKPFIDKTKEPKYALIYGKDLHQGQKIDMPWLIEQNGKPKDTKDGCQFHLMRSMFRPLDELESQIKFIYRQHYL